MGNHKGHFFPFDNIHHDFIEIRDKMWQPLAYLVEEISHVMYYQQCINQPDASTFIKAIAKEINRHVDNKNWKLVYRRMVPERVEVILSVSSMKHEQDLLTTQVTMFKA